MVFESLIREDNAERHPLVVFLIGMLYASLGVIFDVWLFQGRIANLAVFITVIAAVPLMYKIIDFEELKTSRSKGEKSLLKEHEKAIKAFVALFIGMCIAFSFWNLVLSDVASASVFAAQHREVDLVREVISGRIVQPDVLPILFSHNLRVLIFSFLFSFFFGAGAIFVLTWNASILAVAIGVYVKQSMAMVSGLAGGALLGSFVGNFAYGFFGYMSHGIFEIVSYFLAGLAGGIISVAVIKHDLFDKDYMKIVKDASWLVMLAILFLIVGALIEVFLSPVIF